MIIRGQDEIAFVGLSPKGGLVASGASRSILIHSTKTGIVEHRTHNVFALHFSGICYFPNGSLVACGGDFVGGPNLKVFSPSLELVQTLVGHIGTVWCVTISPSGSHLASGGSDKKVMIWSEPGEGGEWARVQVLADHRV